MTFMRLHDYSQLPVLPHPKRLEGVVSWKSIGRVVSEGTLPSTVKECIEDAQAVDESVPLTEAVAMIWRDDYILVRGHDATITGIVTAADLALEFKERTQPFILIGEIEHQLRKLNSWEVHRRGNGRSFER